MRSQDTRQECPRDPPDRRAGQDGVGSPGAAPHTLTGSGRLHRLSRRLIWLLIVGHVALAVHGAVGDSQTSDEGVHLASGVSYWLRGDFRMNSEHPVLWKLIAAAPVLALRPQLSIPAEWWQDARKWQFADLFMHQADIPVTRLLVVGRLPTILASATLIYLLWWFGSRLLGPAAGLIGAGLAALEPTVIGHGHLITTDIPVTLALLGTIVQLWRYVHAPSRRRLAGLIALVSAALLVKYSAVVVYLMIPCLYWLMRRRLSLPMTTLRLTSLMIMGSMAIICVVYGADIARPTSDPRVRELLGQSHAGVETRGPSAGPTRQGQITETDPGRPRQRALETMLNIPVPGFRYLRGLSGAVSHTYRGDKAYLLGRTSPQGWRWYFPVAFALKTPLAYFLLFCIALGGVGRVLYQTRGRLPESLLFILVPLLIYTTVTFPARFNVGIRHYLPAYPFWFLLVGWLWTERFRLTNRFMRGLILVLLTCVPLSVALAHPYELAYFTEAVGGSRQGHKYLLDSNLDWGQDLIRLSAFQRQHPNVPLALDYLGTGDPGSYGVSAVGFPAPSDVASGQFTGIVVISLSRLLDSAPTEHWLQSYRPGGRIGSSLVWYQFPQNDPRGAGRRGGVTSDSSTNVLARV